LDFLSANSSTPWILLAIALSSGTIKVEGYASIGDCIIRTMQQWVDNGGLDTCRSPSKELNYVELQIAGEILLIEAAFSDRELVEGVASTIAQCACAAHEAGLKWASARDMGLAIHFSFGHWHVSEDDDF